MAAVVGKKLVENCQERIPKRIHEGVTSNLFLDVSDFKESDNHKVLHLVWRNFPRKKCPTEGLRTSSHVGNADRRETKKEESLRTTGLDLPIASINSSASDKDCSSVMDIEKFSDLDDSASSSSSGSSDGTYYKSWSKFSLKSFSPDLSVVRIKRYPNWSAAQDPFHDSGKTTK